MMAANLLVAKLTRNSMEIVIVESPYAGWVERNEAYARAAMKDCLLRGEAPFASHLLYTQMLNDLVPEQRDLGIKAGFAFREVSTKTVVYSDFGISRGMQLGIDDAIAKGKQVEYRSLPEFRFNSPEPLITSRDVVSKPGAAIEVHRLNISQRAREQLTINNWIVTNDKCAKDQSGTCSIMAPCMLHTCAPSKCHCSIPASARK